MTYSYRPSNGTEGEIFMEKWCYRCRRDQKFQETHDGNDGCPIILAAMIHDRAQPKYPMEWVSDDDVGLVNPRCTAFEVIA